VALPVGLYRRRNDPARNHPGQVSRVTREFTALILLAYGIGCLMGGVISVRPSSPVSGPVRVLIADDHPLFRDGLAALLRAAAGIELAGAAHTGPQAVELARGTQPDVVLMDLRLPGLTGIEATRQIVASSPRTAVVMLSMFDDDDSVFAALRAGARGYLLKGADQEAILRAVHAAAAGEAIFDSGLSGRVLAHFQQARPPDRQAGS
jgi:DNA-binding NarL/FixJ family response regulator